MNEYFNKYLKEEWLYYLRTDFTNSELDKMKSDINSINRENKIKSILSDSEYKELTIEDHIDYKKKQREKKYNVQEIIKTDLYDYKIDKYCF